MPGKHFSILAHTFARPASAVQQNDDRAVGRRAVPGADLHAVVGGQRHGFKSGWWVARCGLCRPHGDRGHANRQTDVKEQNQDAQGNARPAQHPHKSRFRFCFHGSSHI